MSLITFSCTSPAATWAPTVNPQRGGRVESIENFQPKGFCGTALYSYNHGSQQGVSMEWGYMPAADMTNLLTFLDAMAGGRYPFTFTDYDASTHSARVLNYEAFPVKYSMQKLYFKCVIDLEVA